MQPNSDRHPSTPDERPITRRRRPLRWGVGAAALALLAVTVPAAAGASAGEPAGAEGSAPLGPVPNAEVLQGSPADQAAAFAVQRELDRAAERIRDAGGALARSGFAGDRIDVAANAVTIYWHGALPDRVAAVVEEIRRAGTTVTIRQAAYTRQQLLDERDRLAALGSVNGVAITAVMPRVDGNGVQVTLDAEAAAEADAARQAPGAASATERLDARLTESVALDVTTGQPARPASRSDDAPPFSGGAYAQVHGSQGDLQGLCTTGLPVAGNDGASRYLLTAAHCAGAEWRDGGGDVIGPVAARSPGLDAQLIRTDSGDTIYEGPSIADGGTNEKRTVGGAAESHVGDTVCEGGSLSGSICGFEVTATDLTLTIAGFGSVTDMVMVEAPEHDTGIGNGDSGSPIYTIDASGNADPLGTFSAYSGDQAEWIDCPGTPSGNGRNCSWRWFYPDVNAQIADLDVRF